MTDPTGPDPDPRRGRRALHVVAAILALVATALVFEQTRAYGMLGFDSYPLVLSSRIEGLGDLLGTFTEELADGLYGGDYYRPLLNLSFAADHRLGGIEPWCYQLTNALLYGATGVALFLLVLRTCGVRSGWGALAALVFYLLHDAQFEVLPVPARRPELLCALFALLSLSAQLTPHQLARRWAVLPALLMLAAALSKEAGYALPLVSVLAVGLYSPGASPRERALHALRAGLCHAVAIGALLLLRLWVLGGLGGPSPSQRASELGLLGRTGKLLSNVFAPQNFSQLAETLGVLASLLGLGLALSWILAARAGRGAAVARGPRRALLVAALWIALVAVLHGLSRMVEQWYVFLPVVGVSFALGAGVELLRELWRSSPRLGRGVAVVVGALLLAFSFFQLRYSPLLHAYPEWGRATAASDEFLDELARRIAATPAGQPVDAPPLPRWLPAARRGPAIRGTAILDVYSVQAWAELRFPERELLVLSRPPESPPAAGVTVVRILRARNF